jgi:hypothetical protein
VADPAAAPIAQPQAYNAEGQPIAPEDFAKAAAAGELHFQKGARVYVRRADGQLGSVPAEEAGGQGLSIVSPQEAEQISNHRQYGKGFGNVAQAAVEGGLRGATLGGSDALIAGIGGDEARKGLKGRKEANPIASGVGEVAGMAAPLLLSGGAAGVAEGAEAAEGASALSGAVQGLGIGHRIIGAAGEAAEGAVSRGLGAMGFNAESALGRIGASGLKMGARGAAEGAAYGAAQTADQSVLDDVPLTAERLLAGAWDGAKMGGAFGGGLGVLGAGVGEAGRAIIGKMSQDGSELGENVGTWAERRAFKQAVGNNGKIFDRASNFGTDMAGPARIGRKLLDAQIPAETTQALRRVNELADASVSQMTGVAQAMDQAGVVADTSKILGTIDDQITKLRETPIGDFQHIADRVEKQIAPFRAKMRAPDGAAWTEGTTPQLKFSELWDMRKKLDQTLKWEQKARGPSEGALRDMVGTFRAELSDSITRAADEGTVSPELQGAWKKSMEDYGDFALARDGLKELAKRNAKNRWMSPSDYGTGGLAGVMIGMLTGHAGVGALAAPIIGAAHHLIRERGAGVLARIADRAASVASSVDSAAKVAAMVEAPARLALPVAINVGKQFEHYSGLVAQAKDDPAKFATRMASATADLPLRYPEVAQQIHQTLLADLAYLDSVHPTPSGRKNNTLTPMAKAAQTEWYSFDQKQAFVDAAMALDNPLGVFTDIAHGDLPLDKIKALKARRPGMFSEMQQTVVKYTTQRSDELPFNRRILLGAAFDFSADWSMANIGSIQQSLTASVPSQSPNNPTAAPSKVNSNQAESIQPGGF